MTASTEVRARLLALQSLRDADVSWNLLRADSAPLIGAVLGVHLGGDVRRLPAAELIELVDEDLDELRSQGEVLPRSAQGYCADWRAAGYLVRRPSEDARGETFELSAAALGAIRTLEAMAVPRVSITESRLTGIARQLAQLALDTDADAARRLAQLRAQQAAVAKEIARVEAGDLDVLDHDRATEQARDILTQVSELPADFARVRERFEDLNRTLRERLVGSDEGQQVLLDDVFRGVDLIDESEEGRSFGHFLRLVLDPQRGAELDRDIEQVLDRDFARGLAPAERRTLRRLLATLKDEGGEIHGVISTFARGLRRYVQSQQYQRDRALRRRIREALAAAVEASKHTKPYRETGVSIELSSVPLAGVGAVRLYNPAAFDATDPVLEQQPGIVDWERLRAIARDTEIDFDELEKHIDAARGSVGDPTIAHVLRLFPASQGVGSVVGLLALAAQHAAPGEGSETVSWVGRDEVVRTAKIPMYTFLKELS